MSQNINPDAAPDAAKFASPENPLQGRLSKYSPQELKKLYYRSCNVSAISFLAIAGSAFLLVMLYNTGKMPGQETIEQMPGQEELKRFFITYIIALQVLGGLQTIVAAIGLMMRTNWGRIIGIIVLSQNIYNVPMGTIVSVVGLFALFKAEELFGNDRITHKELKVALKELKKNRIIGSDNFRLN